jgi:hypothetical protein
MSDITVLPFTAYKSFLEKDIHSELKYFYNSFKIEELHQRVKSINHTSHIVELYRDSFMSNDVNFDTHYFETTIKHRLLELTQSSLEQLLVIFQQNYHDRIRLNGLIKFYGIQLNEVFNSRRLKQFPFLEKYYSIIDKEISEYSIRGVNIANDIPKCFNLIVSEDEDQKEKIEILYNLLIEYPPIIDCPKEDFIKLFSNIECSSGIKWLVKGSKNKKEISKPSLVNFLRTLSDKGHIDKSYYSYENQMIINVFRDNLGNKFKSASLSTAKSNMGKTTSQKEKLDNIISKL